MAAKILLLEDDINLSELVEEFLIDEGYEVSLVNDAEAALNLAYEKHFDLWILDVKVPLGDGFSLLKELRQAGKNTPAIFLTSLNTASDLKEGFDAGCDDYIKKPFELVELALRVESILKRSFAHKNENYEDLGDNYKFSLSSQILYKDDKALTLPSKEIKLLSLLLKHKNRFVSVEQIFEELWDYDEEPSELSLRAYVKNLRKILGKDSIINQRGRGYCYDRG
ncbi:two-component system response regulator [Campylobacter sp. MIT 12-8780]|uniref:two-component system response regulator DccR n=1 Tax=unclassified Campylobacter TaxID=2593542 RepID=UPI0010F734CA|nr:MULTISPECIES: response regulator transcription factor [unclassified Campylobacter]NDJ27809.1 response regulator transcription factor [Campylobacter sp. MIT 19-121]TKX30317.1 two-component system response regulator [Campylobacter sp. MIT 12-5580]TQR40989.1 two-component system response regulator [Campylobacter sp. MIT 12-8780]